MNENRENKANSKYMGKIAAKISWKSKFFDLLFLPTVIGIICGLIMVGFNFLLIIFSITFSFVPYFLSPVIGSLLTSILVKNRKLYKILGSGGDEFIKEVNDPELKYRRISNLLAKSFATSWTYGSGMICGREGPGLLIGANVGHLFSDKFKLNKSDYLFIGSSACTAAIFKAPISGALFCAELPYMNYLNYKSLIPSIIASTFSYIAFCLIFQFTPFIETRLFTATPNQISYVFILPLLILFGILNGLIVLLFVKLLQLTKTRLRTIFEKRKLLWVLPTIGGIGYSIFLFFTFPFLNDSYHQGIIHPDVPYLSFLSFNISSGQLTPIYFIISLILITFATVLSIGTINSAGVMMPLMIFGALCGALFGIIFYPNNPELFILLGISATLGAALNNPITAIFIIVEMTWVPFLFIPAGITTIIAYIISGPTKILSKLEFIKE